MTHLKEVDYRRFRELISARTGLNFSERKRADLEAALSSALAQSSFQDLASYYMVLTDEVRGRNEFELLLPYLTVPETYFFRDGPQFNALQQEILPQLIAANQPSRSLRIWSAGCSSGEEPYSVAMLLHELVPDIDAWTTLILGTDINRELLRKAERARYGPWSFRGCPPAITSLYFTPEEGKLQLRPEIEKMVTFAQHNLVSDPYPPLAAGAGGMDLILCRNVTIYFDTDMTRHVANRFYDSLVEGGWLIVGHAEPSLEVYRRFHARNFPNATVYQKATSEPSLPVPDLQWVSTVQAPGPDPFTNHALLVDRTGQPVSPGGAASVAPSPTADDAYRQARACADRGQLEDARRLIEEALAADPLQAKAHYLLGLIDQEQGRWEPSLEAFRRAIFLDRTFVLAHVALAGAAVHTGSDGQARKSLETAHRLLRERPSEELVPGAEGLTVGGLLDAVARRLENE